MDVVTDSCELGLTRVRSHFLSDSLRWLNVNLSLKIKSHRPLMLTSIKALYISTKSVLAGALKGANELKRILLELL